MLGGLRRFIAKARFPTLVCVLLLSDLSDGDHGIQMRTRLDPRYKISSISIISGYEFADT